jgi:hypothetical protein
LDVSLAGRQFLRSGGGNAGEGRARLEEGLAVGAEERQAHEQNRRQVPALPFAQKQRLPQAEQLGDRHALREQGHDPRTRVQLGSEAVVVQQRPQLGVVVLAQQVEHAEARLQSHHLPVRGLVQVRHEAVHKRSPRGEHLGLGIGQNQFALFVWVGEPVQQQNRG